MMTLQALHMDGETTRSASTRYEKQRGKKRSNMKENITNSELDAALDYDPVDLVAHESGAALQRKDRR